MRSASGWSTSRSSCTARSRRRRCGSTRSTPSRASASARSASTRHGEEIPYEQIVKGYEIGPDRYVTITPEELEALEPQKTRTIDIEDFVDLEQIDPIYYDHPYYLAPDTGRGEGLQAAARRDGGGRQGRDRARGDPLEGEPRRASARATACSRWRRCCSPTRSCRPTRSRSCDRGRRRSRPPSASSTWRSQLIESLSCDFEPEKYHDEYRERVLDLIERKAQGETIVIEEPAAGAEGGART